MNKGLYIHIPFCDHICGYCDFARGHYNEELADKYLLALKAELKTKDLKHIETVYVGGGTPTSLNLSQLEFLLLMISPYLKNVKEFTIEANPESLSKDKAKLFKKYGVNRISMGMQVSQNHLLQLIERKHSLQDVKDKVLMLKDVGIDNISIDLMYGIPTQTLEDLKESVSEIVKLDISHVSLYGLTIEPNSKFGKKNYKEANSELDANMYESAIEFLEKANFKRYEISNFAKAGYKSKHNQVYWKYLDFCGVGLFASGKELGVRYTNTRSLKEYINGNNIKDVITLSLEDQMFEFIMMNLRLSSGFNINDFNERFNVDFNKKYKEQLEKLCNSGLLIVENNQVKASDYGLEILNTVLEEFMIEDD